jgi:citrate synthase
MNQVTTETDVLFEVKKEHLNKGMRGIPVGTCETSSVDPHKGLHYVGSPVSEMASWEPEDVIYLLKHRKRGSEAEVAAFSKELEGRTHIDKRLVEAIHKLPREGAAMDHFCASLQLAGMFETTGDYQEDCLNLIAKIPLIVAESINAHAGWGGCRPSDTSLGYMSNFSQMLNVPDADEEALAEVMRLFNVLHYDHGGGNLSAFVGKSTASGLQHLYGSLVSAMNALAGPRHGKANQNCLAFVQEVLELVGENGTEQDVENLIRDKLAKKELVYGFGHAVLRVEDARATILYAEAEKQYSDHPLVKVALMLRTVGPKVLSENPKISNPYPNVDAISGIVLTAAGFNYPEYYTVLFGLSRVVGIAIQIVYERCTLGTPIVRPKFIGV